jgi:hypothetical protein
MNRKLALALGLAACTIGSAANAQQPYPLRMPAEGSALPGEISVAVNYSLAIPLKSDDEKAQAEALESGRRMLYGIAANECKVLQSTIATTCRIERLNVQSNVHRGSRTTDQIQVSGNATYRVTLK